MKAKKKKRSQSLKRAAKIISESIWDFLKTLRPEERDKRLERFHKSVQARVARTRASYASIRQNPGGSGLTVPTRLVARSRQETVILRPQAEESFDRAQDRPHGLSGN